MSNGSYPSRTKPGTVFRGARVDLANKHVYLHDAAECNPSPAVIPTNQTWLGDWGCTDQVGANAGKFVVYLADLSEYHFDMP